MTTSEQVGELGQQFTTFIIEASNEDENSTASKHSRRSLLVKKESCLVRTTDGDLVVDYP